MYSFAQRADTRVVDEPLYGHYLRVTGAKHPGGDQVVAETNCDGAAVMRDLLATSRDISETLFIKHMAHHLVQLDTEFLSQSRNVFLIRDPREMLPSLTVQIPHAGLADTGLRRQCELLAELRSLGQQPVVLDSKELLLNPAKVLQRLCERLGMEFSATMLQWEAGPRPEDGVWASHWYHAVHQSTGFAEYHQKGEFPSRLKSLLAECQPWYDKLYAHAILATPDGD